jgi:hypothetical protein
MVYRNPGAYNLFLCRRTTGRTAQGDAGWAPMQQCAWSGGSTVQSICARGSLSVSCTTAMIDTNVWDYKIFCLIGEGVDSYRKVLKPRTLNHKCRRRLHFVQSVLMFLTVYLALRVGYYNF